MLTWVYELLYLLQQGESVALIWELRGRQFLLKGTCLQLSFITILVLVRTRTFYLLEMLVAELAYRTRTFGNF